MAKPKNTAEHDRILKIALSLFTVKGVSNTSIQDIANAAGVTKSLVQHYFPKKSVFITEFIENCLDAIADVVNSTPAFKRVNSIEKLVYIGYLQFCFILYNDSMKHMKYDILANRDNTIMVIDIVSKWSLQYLKIEDYKVSDKVSDAITFAMGGACEYIYQCLVKDKPLDELYISQQVISILTTTLGIPLVKKVRIPKDMTNEWIEAKCAELNAKLFDLEFLKK